MTDHDELQDIIQDFLAETEKSLEPLEESILLLKQFVYFVPLDFQIQAYMSFFAGLNIDFYLEHIRNVNRVVHTIKGLAGFIGLDNLKNYCHDVENLTTGIAKGELLLNQEVYDVIARIPVWISRALESVRDQGHDKSLDTEQESRVIGGTVQTIRALLDGQVIHFDELKGRDYGRVREQRKKLSVHIELGRYDVMVSDLQSIIQFSSQSLHAAGVDPSLLFTLQQQWTRHLDQLITSAQIPLTITRYPRIIKDLGLSQDKDIEFTILRNEALARPDTWDHCHNALVHLIRNAVDHGIEGTAERQQAGKPTRGRITLSVFGDFKSIFIEVTDDGKGLDPEKISQTAIRKNVVTPEAAAAMSDSQKQRLIFLPGFSTRTEITDISGRGVGMDAVIREIETVLSGTVHLESTRGKGTRFLLEIPRAETLSECIVFGDQTYRYALPVAGEIHFLECQHNALHQIFDRGLLYEHAGEGQFFLLDIMGILHPDLPPDPSHTGKPIITIGNGHDRFGLLVPHIFGQERINIDRRRIIRQASGNPDLVFGFGLTDPVTVVLDLDRLRAFQPAEPPTGPASEENLARVPEAPAS